MKALDVLAPSLALYTVSSWTAGETSSGNELVLRALTTEWTLNLMKEILGTEGKIRVPYVTTAVQWKTNVLS